MRAIYVDTTQMSYNKLETQVNSPITKSFLMLQHHLHCQAPLMLVPQTWCLYSAGAAVVLPGIGSVTPFFVIVHCCLALCLILRSSQFLGATKHFK